MSVGITLLFLVLLVFVASFAYAGLRGAPWVPTWGRDIKRLGELLDLKPGQTFCELGCGDGRVTIAMSEQFDVDAIGVELSLAQYLAACLRKLLSKSKKTTILWKDAFNVDLRDVDALYLFLMPETYKKIKTKLEKELKPGTKVVTYVWAMPGWKPEKVDKLKDAPILYLYKR